MNGLRERASVLEERLQLALEQVQLAEKVRLQLEADLSKLQLRPGVVDLIDIKATKETADRAVGAFGYLADKLREVLMAPGDHHIDIIPVIKKPLS
jgi:hypothetical protein